MNRILVLLTAAAISPLLSRAEDPLPPIQFYKLNFVVQEMDGTKVINRREYSAIASTDVTQTNTSIRTTSTLVTTIKNGTSSQSRQFDIGVYIDAKSMHETQNGLSLNISTSIDSIPVDTDPNNYPTVRKNSWTGTLLITPRKPTLVFSSDDVTSKNKMEVLLTATPLK